MYIYTDFDDRQNAKNQDEYQEATTLGAQLKYCREADGFSLEEVARYLRKSPQTLYKYEHDILSIPYKDLTLLALLYFRSLEFFCEPFRREFLTQNKSTAALLLRYIQYSDKFCYAHRYFPDKSEYNAIAIIAGYTLLAIPPVL